MNEGIFTKEQAEGYAKLLAFAHDAAPYIRQKIIDYDNIKIIYDNLKERMEKKKVI